MHPPCVAPASGDIMLEEAPVDTNLQSLPPVQALSHEGSAQSPPRHDAQVPVHDPPFSSASESAPESSQSYAAVTATMTPESSRPPEASSSTAASVSRPASLLSSSSLSSSPPTSTSSLTSAVRSLSYTTHPSTSPTTSAPASEASSTAGMHGAASHNVTFYLGITFAAIAGVSFLIALLAWWLRIRRPRKRHRQPLFFPFPEHPPKKPPSVMTETDKRVPQLPDTRRLLRAPLDPEATPRPPLRRLPTALQHSDASVPALAINIGTPCIANLVPGDILFSDSSVSASRPASAGASLAGDDFRDRTPRSASLGTGELPVAWAPFSKKLRAGMPSDSEHSISNEKMDVDSEATLPLVREMSPKAQRGTWAGAFRTNIAHAFNVFSAHGSQAQAPAASTSQSPFESTDVSLRSPRPLSLEQAQSSTGVDHIPDVPEKLISPFSDAAVSSSSDGASSRYSVTSAATAHPPTMNRGCSLSSQSRSSEGDRTQTETEDGDKTRPPTRPSHLRLHSSFGTSATSVGSDMTRASSRRLTEREEAARRALRERRKRVNRARVEALREKNERLVQARVEVARRL